MKKVLVPMILSGARLPVVSGGHAVEIRERTAKFSIVNVIDHLQGMTEK